MTTKPGISPCGQRRSVSESSSESVASVNEDEESQDEEPSMMMSNLSSPDATDLSGMLNMDAKGEGSPRMATKHVRHGAASKKAASACWRDSVEEESHILTHRHVETLVRRPLRRGEATRTKDSCIEYTSQQCTVISEHRHGSTGWTAHFVVALVLICVVCSVSLVVSFLPTSYTRLAAEQSKSNISSEMFLQAFNSVKESFGAQTSGFWGIIRAAIKRVALQENPDQPAVFVLMVPSDAYETSACFIRVFSDAITNLFQAKPAVEFFTDTLSGLSPDRVKQLLDDRLKDGLSSGSRIATVHHLEQLHGESAMMLHAYCDNKNAPFRRAIFILTLFVDETSSDPIFYKFGEDTLIKMAETETFVEERLKLIWGETLGTNRFYPLITRIAHSVAFVHPETSDILTKINC